jgi:hypothetical protein
MNDFARRRCMFRVLKKFILIMVGLMATVSPHAERARIVPRRLQRRADLPFELRSNREGGHRYEIGGVFA